MKNIIKKLLIEGLNHVSEENSRDEEYFQEIDYILNEMINSKDTIEPIPIPDFKNYYFEKKGDEIEITHQQDEISSESYLFNINQPEKLKLNLLNMYFKFNVGQNVKPSKYDTEKINARQLRVGDVYIRDISGTRYIYKLLSNITPKDKRFYFGWVEVLDVGNQMKRINKDIDGGYDILGHNIGDRVRDKFKDMNAGYRNSEVKFGNIIKILNF